ncbi:MAG: amidohydrolase [Planctomycetota bacterium]
MQPNEAKLADVLFRNAKALTGADLHIAVRGGRIVSTDDPEYPSKEVVDCLGHIAAPPFTNAHTHSAMTLFRGWGDDMPLHAWLNERIWPAEGRMTPDDVYAGARLACLEMIMSGTVFFNDMYWFPQATVQAALDCGMRACISGVLIDLFDPESARRQRDEAARFVESNMGRDPRLTLAIGPHAIYTVSEESLVWCAEYTRRKGIQVHIHLSETSKEVEDCRSQHGLSPVEYLDRIGFLGPNVVAAHCVWLSDNDVRLLSENQVTVAHIPVSNAKLAVGEEFSLPRLREAGVRVLLGTDGAASNNSLDMFGEMKFAALTQKSRAGDPLAVKAEETWESATNKGREVFGLGRSSLEIGQPADFMLLDSSYPSFVPMHDVYSNLVYSSTGALVWGLVCDGKALMLDRKVEWAEEAVAKAREVADRLCF